MSRLETITQRDSYSSQIQYNSIQFNSITLSADAEAIIGVPPAPAHSLRARCQIPSRCPRHCRRSRAQTGQFRSRSCLRTFVTAVVEESLTLPAKIGSTQSRLNRLSVKHPISSRNVISSRNRKQREADRGNRIDQVRASHLLRP